MNNLMNILLLRLKLNFRNPAVKILLIIIIILFISLIGSLYANTEESMHVNIGYVNEGSSNLSKEIILNINNNDFLNPSKTSLEEGINEIEQGKIEALFIINAEIEDKVLAGDFDELI